MDKPLRLAWETRPPSYVFEPPIAGKTTVLLKGRDGHYGLHASSGALRWRFPETGSGDNRPWLLRTAFGPVSYGRFDGRWSVIGLGFDGTPRWRVSVDGRGACATPTLDRRGLWLFSPRKSGRGLVRCIDRDGKIVAKLDAIDDAHQIVEFGGALYLAGMLDEVRGVYRVALPTGAIRRVSDGGGETLFTARDALVVSPMGDPWAELRCLDAHGATRWKVRGNACDVHRGRVIAAVPRDDPKKEHAKIACLDLDTGATRWTSTLDGIDNLTFAVCVDDLVCVNGPSLDALDLGDGTLRQQLLEADATTRHVDVSSAWRGRLVVARGSVVWCWERDAAKG